MEGDPLVQEALFNVLNASARSGVGPRSLSQTLALTLQLDRSQLRDSLAKIEPRSDADGNLSFSDKTREQGLAEAVTFMAEPDKINQLRRVRQLTVLSRAISLLISQGARANDFSWIYCESCDFRPLKMIGKANFSHAILPDAHFDNMILRGADFRESHFSSTQFTGANLVGADFSHESENDGDYGDAKPPVFACADLRSANLDGLLLLHQETSIYGHGDNPEAELTLEGPRFDQARIDSTTKLDKLRIVHHLKISGRTLRSTAPVGWVKEALRDLASRMQSAATAVSPSPSPSIQWPSNDTYNHHETFTLPLDDGALSKRVYLSVASVYRFAQDNQIRDVEKKFGLLARNVNASDAFFAQDRGHREGSAVCTPGNATSSADYRWYIYTDFDTPAQAQKSLSSPYNPPDPAAFQPLLGH